MEIKYRPCALLRGQAKHVRVGKDFNAIEGNFKGRAGPESKLYGTLADDIERLAVAYADRDWLRQKGHVPMGAAMLFESWVGGVLPKARKQGIASQLARLQEAWCRANGFQFIQPLYAP